MDVKRLVLNGSTARERRDLNRTVGRYEANIDQRTHIAEPWWALGVTDLVDYLSTHRSSPRAHRSLAENLARPITRFGWDQLCHRLGQEWQRILSDAAGSSLRKTLSSRLLSASTQAIDWTWDALQTTPGLSSRDRASLETLFFAGGVETAACRLLQHYPALARLWAVQVGLWSRSVEALLKDARSFKGPNKRLEGPRLIQSLQLDLSDLHEDNRSVARVRFVDGSCWFYKPRSGQCEEAWFDLLAWVNSTGFPLCFKVVKVVCAERHCWMEEVAHRPCKNRSEVGDYFFRAGALLCLVHWLGGVDFHAGNIIAHGAQPIIVDCETFFHPATTLPATAKAEERSLLRTGMLPIHRRKPSFSDSLSAFGRVSFGPHSVRLNGKVIFTEDFRDEVMQGFHTMFTHLHSHVETTGMRRMITRLGRAPHRTIYRPTSHYYAVLEASLTPALLTSGVARSRFLVATCRRGYTPSSGCNQEVEALENADIPVFRGKNCALRCYTRQAMQQDMKILAEALAPIAATAPRYTARFR